MIVFGSLTDVLFGLLLYHLERTPAWINGLFMYVGMFVACIAFAGLYFLMRTAE